VFVAEPTAVLFWPAWQRLHCADPIVSCHCPAGQGAHKFDVAPVAVRLKPCWHYMHDDWPVLFCQLPGAHKRQLANEVP
jgi:hypothetical protein